MTTPPGPRVARRGSVARWLASRNPAVTWFDAPDGSTSETTATSVASGRVSSAHSFATIGPVTWVSALSGGVVHVSDEASNVRLSVSHGPSFPAPAVHCAVSLEHGEDAGSSGASSVALAAG